MKRILVTGGAGFIGSHLCERLIYENNEVICLDNFFTGRKKNIEHLIKHPNFTLVVHDVIYPYFAEVDEIYNMACPASPVYYQHDPVKTIKTSVLGAINMLDLAKNVNAKILQASTSEVYGDPTIHPQPENYWGNVNPIGTRSCYDEGKRCAESLFINFHKQNGVRIKIARIFNTYGPRMSQNDGRVVSNFVVQALVGNDITIFGEGKQTRSFQYIDDLIEGLIRLMGTENDVIGPFNIGNPEEITIMELANKIVHYTHSMSKITFDPLPQDDPIQRKPDTRSANKMLDGWRPSIKLDTGLKLTIDYFQELLSETNVVLSATFEDCNTTK